MSQQHQDQRTFIRNFLAGFTIAAIAILLLFYATGTMELTTHILTAVCIVIGIIALVAFVLLRSKR